ncbi:hypothetical protein N7508_000070 [Penicillium antarcticum]|nr:uncharacterized protein N7508_000070 [Penicillium antarcticum]KAJ5319787.1 hypothetical protein N7508_000070 [Penicillium antarcticum]
MFFTPTYHSKPYPDLDPLRQVGDIKGKTVVITGGGSGIGKAIALAFSKANAANIVVVGRTKETLDATKQEIEGASTTRVKAIVADVTNATEIQRAFSSLVTEIGPLHVLVNNAGYLAEPAPAASAPIQDWWKAFEINCKGALLVTQSFLSVSSDEAVLINVTTAGVYLPPTHELSAYSASKLAFLRVLEFVQLEYPGLRVVNVHPGFIQTDMNLKSGIKGVPFDDIELTSHFVVWCSGSAAAFLNGRFVWANWDINELKNMERSIVDEKKLTFGLLS